MPQSVCLKFLSYTLHKLQGGETEYRFNVLIKDLVEAVGNVEHHKSWKIPLDINVRRPSKGYVTNSIVQCLSSQQDYQINSPIHVSANCRVNSKDFAVLTFSEEGTHGILDGAHRVLAFIIASLDGINLGTSSVPIFVYSGFSDEKLRQKAIALNTSKSVSSTSIANYSGKFDEFKPLLEPYRIIYFEGQAGKYSPTVDGCCHINRILGLVLCLDPAYSPVSISSRKRHPVYVAKSGNLASRLEFKEKSVCMKHLLPSTINMQTEIILEAQSRHNAGMYSPFFRTVNDSRKCTKLPTGEILSYQMTTSTFVLPILASFRFFIDQKTFQWSNSVPKEKKKRSTLFRKLIARYCEICQHQKYQTMTLNAVALDEYTWEEMAKITIKFTESSQ